jgi:DNA invertase Pin-like site-specific DNA recombinase
VKVIGYVRVSTAEQARDGFSLDAQRKAIEAECERRGWELVEVIEDDGYTGRNDDRPGLQRALRLLAKRKAKAVVVARLDRLARSLLNLAQWIDVSAKQKWAIVALDHELNTTTANGRLVARIIASVAQWESEINGERVRDGMAEARAARKAAGEPVRFGFQRKTPDATVTRIIRARNRGDSFNTIAKRLDKQRIPTPNGGARWYPSTVARIYNAATSERAS